MYPYKRIVKQGGIFLVIKLAVIAAVLITLVIILTLIFYKKVGPGEILVVYGLGKKIKIISGPRGYFFVPLLQTYRVLSREPFTVKCEIPCVLIQEGVSIEIEGTARLKLIDDFLSIQKAAQTMLNKTQREKASLITSIIDEAARRALKKADPQRLVSNQEDCAQDIISQAKEHLDRIGYELQSLAFSQLSDKLGYLNALTRRITAEKKARFAIEEAYITREGQNISSMIKRDTQVQRIGQRIEEKARADIDMEKVMLQTEDYFKKMKVKLDKGIKGISKNLYAPGDAPKDDALEDKAPGDRAPDEDASSQEK